MDPYREGRVIFYWSDEVSSSDVPSIYIIKCLKYFLCDFWRAVCSALPNFLINHLLFNQLSGSLLNFSLLLIYCEGWGYGQKLSNSVWMKWHITIIMIENRIVPGHTEELEEIKVYIKASLRGRPCCCRKSDTHMPGFSTEILPAAHVVAASVSPQDTTFFLPCCLLTGALTG